MAIRAELLGALAERLGAVDGELARRREAPWLAQRDALIRRIRGLVARLERAEEPLLVVLAGGTGAGKSTLANTLAGRAVSATGVRRPTTTAPAAIGRPEDLDRVLGAGVLADGAGAAVETAPSPGFPEGLVVIDAPDVDSVETANRAATERLLEVADVWVWLVTPRTYADEAGMAYLRRAAQLDAATVVVLSQASAAEAEEILPDLRVKLADAGHRIGAQATELYTLAQADPRHEQLPAEAAAAVVERIRGLAPPEERARQRQRTVLGAAGALPGELDELLEAAEAERRAVAVLEEQIEEAYAAVAEQVLGELQEGVPLRQEVLQRWRQLVGQGWLQQRLERAAGRLPSGVRGWIPGLGRRAEAIQQEAAAEAQEGIAGLVREALDHAAARTETAWIRQPAGRAVLSLHTPPRAAGVVAQYEAAAALVGQWRDRVAEHVATTGQAKLSRARRATAGINATFTSAALVLFALSGGLTAGEVALTAAGSTTTHAVLSRMLGERNLHELIREIRADLRERVDAAAAQEGEHYRRLLQGAAPTAEALAAVRALRDELAAAAP